MGLTGEFVVTRKSRAVRHEQAVNRLTAEIASGEESAANGGWIDEEDVFAEFGVRS